MRWRLSLAIFAGVLGFNDSVQTGCTPALNPAASSQRWMASGRGQRWRFVALMAR
jgi:hypothetical protein